ncbi:helix-turn-helix domain-containing protein [Pseudomonas sp. OIL-1]|uniref:helix-turn-helix domain-containing protein n=1 Tax=Pseudomonas sp. OIL-1 TaxID=2706126 RepID=UPI00353216C2
MNIELMSAVFALECDPRDKNLMLFLAFRSNADGLAWPGVARIAEAISQSLRSTQRRLKRLVAQGLLEIIPRTAAGGRQTSNFYRLLPAVSQASAPETSIAGNGSDLSLSRVTAWVSPQELTKERKSSGVASGGEVGKYHLEQLQQRLRGRFSTKVVTNGGDQ